MNLKKSEQREADQPQSDFIRPDQSDQEAMEQDILEKAPIPKAIAQLCLPMMLGMSVGVIYNLINAFFIGQLHNTAMLSAVTLGLPVYTILMAVGNLFGVGGGTYISRLLGEKKTHKAASVASFSFWGCLLAGLLLIGAGFLLLHPLVQLLGADADSFAYTLTYIRVLIAGSPLVMAFFALEQIVRAEGAAKESMNGMLLGTLANLVLDPLFLFVFKWDVAGAALALVLSGGVSVLYYAWYLQKKSPLLTISPRAFRATAEIVGNTFKIGLSELLMSLFLMLTTLVLNHYAISYGDRVVAGFGVSLRIVQFPEFICMGLSMGIIPLLAYSFAAGKMRRFTGAWRLSALAIGLSVGIFSGLVFAFRESVLRLFSTDAGVLHTGLSILTAMLISSLFTGFTSLFTGVFQAAGKAVPATVMSVAQGLIFIPVIFLGNRLFGLNGVIWSLTVTEVLTCLTGLTMFLLLQRSLGRAAEEPAAA